MLQTAASWQGFARSLQIGLEKSDKKLHLLPNQV
jgi:hypothetical protein